MNFSNTTMLPREELAIACDDAVAEITKRDTHFEDVEIGDLVSSSEHFDKAVEAASGAAKRLVSVYGVGKFTVHSFRDDAKAANVIRVSLETFVLK